MMSRVVVADTVGGPTIQGVTGLTGFLGLMPYSVHTRKVSGGQGERVPGRAASALHVLSPPPVQT